MGKHLVVQQLIGSTDIYVAPVHWPVIPVPIKSFLITGVWQQVDVVHWWPWLQNHKTLKSIFNLLMHLRYCMYFVYWKLFMCGGVCGGGWEGGGGGGRITGNTLCRGECWYATLIQVHNEVCQGLYGVDQALPRHPRTMIEINKRRAKFQDWLWGSEITRLMIFRATICHPFPWLVCTWTHFWHITTGNLCSQEHKQVWSIFSAEGKPKHTFASKAAAAYNNDPPCQNIWLSSTFVCGNTWRAQR